MPPSEHKQSVENYEGCSKRLRWEVAGFPGTWGNKSRHLLPSHSLSALIRPCPQKSNQMNKSSNLKHQRKEILGTQNTSEDHTHTISTFTTSHTQGSSYNHQSTTQEEPIAGEKELSQSLWRGTSEYFDPCPPQRPKGCQPLSSPSHRAGAVTVKISTPQACKTKVYKQVTLEVVMGQDEPLICPFEEALVAPAAGVSSADSFQVSVPLGCASASESHLNQDHALDGSRWEYKTIG